MTLFFIVAFLAVSFILIGLFLWLLRVVFRVSRKGFRIVTGTLVSFLVSLPSFLFLILPLIASHLVANASTRSQDRNLSETPASYGRDFDSVEFSSRDGLTLSGWLMEGHPDKPTVILTHGLLRNRQEVLDRGCALNKEDFPVFLFDFRNHGGSDHRYVSLGFEERLDILGAFDFLRERRPEGRVVLMGVSMGAVAAIHAAADLGGVLEAIVADSPFSNLRETVAHHTSLILHLPAFPFEDLFVWNLTRIGGFRADELDTVRAVQMADPVPVLLIYGANDRRMPKPTARAVFEAVPHPGKRIVFFEGATHGAAYRIDPDLYLETVLNFLKAL